MVPAPTASLSLVKNIYMIRSWMEATTLSLSQEKLKTMLMQNFGANKVCFWRCASGEWKNQKKRHPGSID